MAHLLFFRTCRHSGVTVGTLDLDRALERTSIMQRVTYEKTQECVGKLVSQEHNSTRSFCHKRLECVPRTDAGPLGQGHRWTGPWGSLPGYNTTKWKKSLPGDSPKKGNKDPCLMLTGTLLLSSGGLNPLGRMCVLSTGRVSLVSKTQNVGFARQHGGGSCQREWDSLGCTHKSRL